MGTTAVHRWDSTIQPTTQLLFFLFNWYSDGPSWQGSKMRSLFSLLLLMTTASKGRQKSLTYIDYRWNDNTDNIWSNWISWKISWMPLLVSDSRSSAPLVVARYGKHLPPRWCKNFSRFSSASLRPRSPSSSTPASCLALSLSIHHNSIIIMSYYLHGYITGHPLMFDILPHVLHQVFTKKVYNHNHSIIWINMRLIVRESIFRIHQFKKMS